ncbi:MAG: stage II sporulation protein D [Butyricicoccus pullicaecorum]|nr:stage II sporulation protein D [Butyricicoccus pullicaecorum]
MRKMLVIGLLLTVTIYMLPVFCGYLDTEAADFIPQEETGIHAEISAAQAEERTEKQKEEQAPPISASGRITVQVDGQAREMALEDYVVSVVSGEISPDFPEEAIKAQAVAARTYALYKQQTGRPAQHKDADVCDNPAHCAAYVDLKTQASARWGEQADADKIRQAVKDTEGMVVTYEGKPIVAVFSAAAGEKSERAEDVWGSDIPYLQSVDSPGGEACPKYHATVTLSADEVRRRAAKNVPSADLSGDPSEWFKASKRSEAGGIISVKFGGVEVQGTALRTLFGLNSTNFTVKTEGDMLTFSTTGYGHGVGLSQWGAKYAAEQGQTWQEILTHYYSGTKITQITV